jgi:hypothetical protein
LTYGQNGFRSADKITTFQDGEIKGVANRTFDYNDGLLKSIMYVSNDPNFKPTEVEFQWTKNNITRIDFYYHDNNERFYNGNRTFIYDDKLNYSNQDIAFTYLFGLGDEVITSKNNLIMSQEDTGNNVYKSGQYSFSYNKNGYPINYTYRFDGREFTPIQIKYQ